jgi:hypothetical protein
MDRSVRGLLVALIVLLGACGDDDAPPPGDGGLDGAVMDGGPSSSGSGGSGGTSSATGGIGGGLPAVPSIMCGEITCTAPGADLIGFLQTLVGPAIPLGSFLPTPCCADDGACGVSLPADGGSLCVPEPPSDPRCPNADVFGTTLIGCCDETMGACGANFSQSGLGCVVFTLPGVPPAATCGGDDGGADVDADGGATN